MDEKNPHVQSEQSGGELKPGDTISPREAAPVAPQAPPAAPDPAPAPVSLPLPEPEPAPPIPEDPVQPPLEQAAPLQDDEDAITWTASEFIAHQKSAAWYLATGLVFAAIAAIVFLLTRDVMSTAVIIVVGVVLVIYGARQPRQLQYALSANGLLVANRYFPFSMFRSFAVIDEGGPTSIVFTPLQRFGQLLTIYVDPADEERIVGLLSSYLPLDRRSTDMLDRFMKRIRF